MPSSKEPRPIDSGSGGKGGTAARLVGRCGELTFLDEGEPGSILLKLYEENLLDALRSSGSCLDKAASVDLVSGGTSGICSTGSGGVIGPSTSVMLMDSDGRLRTGSEGARLEPDAIADRTSGEASSSASSSARVDIRLGGVRLGGDRIGEPFVTSESAENRDVGRGLPKLSRLNRSGLGGVGLTTGGGASAVGMGIGEGDEEEETGPSVS